MRSIPSDAGPWAYVLSLTSDELFGAFASAGAYSGGETCILRPQVGGWVGGWVLLRLYSTYSIHYDFYHHHYYYYYYYYYYWTH